MFNLIHKHVIYYYKNNSGRNLVIDFIKSFDKTIKSDIFETINRLETDGLHLLFTNLCKKIHSKPPLFELRVKTRIQIRIIFCQINNNDFLVLNIFVKKTQKTPPNEIKTSLKRQKAYID